jgi:RecB family endonuclease NucS
MASELPSRAARLEKQVQDLVEANMPTFLGVRLLASEYATGKTHKGRIDSLGLDENGCAVIIEYKRHSNENVIKRPVLSGLVIGFDSARARRGTVRGNQVRTTR